MKIEDKKLLLKEFYDSVSETGVKEFMNQCVEIIPDYWFHVAASSTGKYHPSFALGEGGLKRHTIALLRFLNRHLQNNTYSKLFTKREQDLLRVACLMHDAFKSGTDNDYSKSKYTRFDHPILAANAVRGIQTTNITDAEKELIASGIETHMGEWNTDKRSDVVLPLPKTKFQILVHMVDYLAADKNISMQFDEDVPAEPKKEVITEEQAPSTKDYELTFGKYKGMKLLDVKKEHPDYIEWMKENIDREPLKTILNQMD